VQLGDHFRGPYTRGQKRRSTGPWPAAASPDMITAFVPEDEFRAMVHDGRFTDGPSLAAYSLLLLARE